MKRIIFFLFIFIVVACVPQKSQPRENGPLAQAGGNSIVCSEGFAGESLPSGAIKIRCTTPEPEPSPTETATATPLPVPPTFTPQPTNTATTEPTATVSPTLHDVTSWHPPGDGHHHGADPANIPEARALYMQYCGQEIGCPWYSSQSENLFPFPTGKHEGFKHLQETDTGCPTFQLPVGTNCIKAYDMQIHSIGTATAPRTANHSVSAAVLICDNSTCGWVFTGGHMVYVPFHSDYKDTICLTDSLPPGYIDNVPSFPPPYVAHHQNSPSDIITQFWSTTGPNHEIIQYYPNEPHNTLRTNWSSLDAWEKPNQDPALCTDPDFDFAPCPDGSCALNHTLFIVHSIEIWNLPAARPFDGFTNVWGHIDLNCTEISATCVPLHIDASVPTGTVSGQGYIRGIEHNLNGAFFHPVRQRCEFAFCQEFDDGTPLIMPGYEED